MGSRTASALLWGVAWLSVSGGCGLWTSRPPPDATEGHPAPAIQSVALGGAPFALEDLQGRPVVLVFWASWCGPCRREVPALAALISHYGERVAVVSVNAGEEPPTVAQAAAAWGISWPVVFDPAGRIQADYAVDALPLVLILDPEGWVRFRGFGLPEAPHDLLDGLLPRP